MGKKEVPKAKLHPTGMTSLSSHAFTFNEEKKLRVALNPPLMSPKVSLARIESHSHN